MAKSLNKVQLIGNLGQDPEVKYMPNGNAVVNMSIACSESWKDKNSGELVEKTEWIRLAGFGKVAEICGEYLKKGSKIYVEGKFTTDKYQDKDGKDTYASKVIFNNMMMLDGRPAGAESGGGGSSKGTASQQAAPAGGGMDDFDDDIPF